MHIIFASDHAGYELKNVLVAYVRDTLGYSVEDMGPTTYEADDDYPDYIAPAMQRMQQHSAEVRAIILGGSGQGEAMVANRFSGIRAAVCYDKNLDIIRLSRQHNDANVLSLGARFLSASDAQEIVQTWLATDFSGESRHMRRITKIDELYG